jgi:SAM-dependent methyltransferase
MLPEGHRRVLALPETARVLDVGGWAAPVNRADWVIDLMPYETRGALAPDGVGPGPPRFTAETWMVADICSHRPWPFADDFFDFAVCTFTLEDVRDPIRVCEELSRVAKAGYIEVPSLLDELTWRNPEPSGGQWVGHTHHRWLCSLEGDELVFLPKWHGLHANRRAQVPAHWASQLTSSERVLAHFWEGSLPARERAAIATYPDAELEAAIERRFGRTQGRLQELRELVVKAVPSTARSALRRALLRRHRATADSASHTAGRGER